MQEHFSGEGWHVTSSPNKARLTELLSNGQYMSLWFHRRRVQGGDEGILYIWTVALYIGSKKGAARWRRKGVKVSQTGSCGLEGLKVALDAIKSFTKNMGYREELQIGHSDMKRHRAYKYLLRYPGFAVSSIDKCISFRIPGHWEWIPNQKEIEK